MRVRIVTDTPSDVPGSLLERHHLQAIPVYINFGLESFVDHESVLPREEFYARSKASPILPTTSAASPGDHEKVLREVLKDADHVIAVHITGRLSSVIESTRVAAAEIGHDKVSVVDSGLISLGSGFLAIMAAEMAESGADVPAILAALESAKKRVRVWAALNTLENLRRSGRVSWVRASFGAMLDIKPIIFVGEGEVTPAGRVRRFEKVFAELSRLAHTEVPLERLGILHTNAPQGAQRLREMLADIAPPDQTYVVDVSPAFGVHLGQGALGIATVRKADS